MPSELESRLGRIRLAAFDVDGVFTDGRFLLLSDGRDAVSFHTRDGLGVRMLLEMDVVVALITGRKSDAVKDRAQALGIPHLIRGSGDKGRDLRKIADQTGINLMETLFMGDDLPDLPAFTAAGVAVTVPGAPPEVVTRADLVTTSEGGHGAVREVAERILKAKGRWPDVLRRFAEDGK